MMLQSTTLDLFPPGVRLVGGRRRAPLRGVLHDVAGFVGLAERGPLDRAVRVASIQEFQEVFGGPIPQAHLAPSVRLFFENGGRAAWIVRVAHQIQSRKAGVIVQMPDGPDLLFEASSPGSWGNRIVFRLEPEAEGVFTLRISAPGRPQEIWPGLRAGDMAEQGDSFDGAGLRTLSIAETPVSPASLGSNAGGASVLMLAPLVGGPGALKVPTFNGRTPFETILAGGQDGISALTAEDFGIQSGEPRGLALLEDVDEVALLAIPDIVWSENIATFDPPEPETRCEDYFINLALPPRLDAFPDPETPEERLPLDPVAQARIRQAMVSQAQRLRDRFAILDCARPSNLRRIFDDGNPDPAAQRLTDGEFAAMYYPWLETNVTGPDIVVPPSGAMAGIYARTTLLEGPHIAPANVPIEAVTGVTYAVSDTEHARLNAAHVNVIRPVPGRGLLPMGARTRRRDGPFQQVAIRRLVNFILETLDEETQWLVFEPNDANLRLEVARAMRGFLDRLWRAGALDGARPEDAYSVTAGPEVNPPSSIDAGRLICELAVRVAWPVEWIRLRLVREDGGFQLLGVDTGRQPEDTRES